VLPETSPSASLRWSKYHPYFVCMTRRAVDQSRTQLSIFGVHCVQVHLTVNRVFVFFFICFPRFECKLEKIIS
jgi:hypothetical protein